MGKVFQSLKISQKIWAGFIAILIILAAISGETMWSLAKVKSVIGALVKESQPTVLISKNLETSLHASANALGFFLSTEEEIHKTNYLDSIREAETLLGDLNQRASIQSAPQSAELTQGLATDLATYKALGDRLIQTATDNETNFPGIAFANREINPLSRELAQLTSQMIISEQEEEANDDRKRLLTLVADLRYYGSNIMNGIRGYLAFRSKEALADLHLYFDQQDRLLEKLAEYEDILTFDQEDSLMRFKEKIVAYRANIKTMEQIHGSEQWRTDAWLVRSELTPLFESMDSKLGTLVTIQEQAIEQTSGDLVSTAQGTSKLVTIFLVAGLLLGALFAWLITRSVNRPLTHIVHAMNDIAEGEGDLTKRLEIRSNDEIGQVAQAFNTFIKKIQELVRHTADSTGEVISAVAQTTESANKITRKSAQQALETEQIVQAVSDLTATITEVANNAFSAEDATKSATAEAQIGHKTVAETAAAIQQLSNDVRHAATIIVRVEKSSEEIGSVLDVIKAIAEQTNLLALNAAIEAARAGEQGRGFAVVADEVRGLATRTQESTGEIEQMIRRLQGDTREAVQAMETGSSLAQENVEQSTRAKASLEAISRSIETISAMNSQIASASEHQRSVADGINVNINSINQGSIDVAAYSRDTESVTEHLGKLASDLQQVVCQFKLAADQAFDFQTAKQAHIAWKARLRGFLDGRQSLSDKEAVSHHDCILGKWYYSEGMKKYGGIAEMRELEPPHEQLHQIIKTIVALKKAGKLEQAEQEYAKVEPLSLKIIGLLSRVEKQVKH
jgi:methyl-accepting chemotaxis protein